MAEAIPQGRILDLRESSMIARFDRSAQSLRLIRLFAVALTATTALGGISPTGASGHTATVGSQHSLNFVPRAASGFSGSLTSETPDCAVGRAVTIYRIGPSGDAAVATTSTGTQGGSWWRSAVGFQAGDYYAVAAASLTKSPGHKHSCASARSNLVTVPPDGDADGVTDPYDNCPGAANPGQADTDGDWRGDACDDDADGDGYTAAAGDCADTDRNRYPGRPDTTQNGIDDNCDGNVDEGYYAGIVYSDDYLKLIAEFPSGMVPNACEAAAFLSGGGVCTTEMDPHYFYPDGTLGKQPWIIDPSSPRGWSIEPHPCDVLTDADYQEWQAYLEADPSMSDAELQAGLTHPFDLYVTCYVPFEGF